MHLRSARRPSALGGLLIAIPLISCAGSDDPRIWYQEPAKQWEHALPIGCGRLGAMVFGGTADERIQFNEDTLWTGKPNNYVRVGARDHLEEIRRLLFEGKFKEATPIVRGSFLSDPVRQEAYQPFGDLRLRFPGHEGAVDYRRELDLDSAVARVTYRVGDVTHRREAFASYPDQVILVHLEADRGGSVGFRLTMDSPHTSARCRAAAADTLAMAGRVGDDGLRFESRLRVFASGGRAVVDDEGITVEGADSATLVLAAATSYKNFQDISADPGVDCEIDPLAAWSAVRATRQSGPITSPITAPPLPGASAWTWGGTSANPTGPHDRRILARADTADANLIAGASAVPRDTGPGPSFGLRDDPALATLYFQYGRYLLIASSRPGTQPANLQGIWNELLDPPWESKYTTNINLEMNYS